MQQRARQRATRTVRAILGELRRPSWQAPGHYYSPIPSADDVERATRNRRVPVGVQMDEAEQRHFAAELTLAHPSERRWSASNGMFGSADASILRSVLLHFRPKRIVEVGSGFSTALMLDVAEEQLSDMQITCIEPYTDRLRSRLLPQDHERLNIIESSVQDIEPSELIAGLGSGDIFFIDSTHVVKAGSDVCHLILHTLPLLPVGAIVHVHDIFWPFEYPDKWLHEGRSWTEAYLLQAFLSHNEDWKILLFGSWLWETHIELAPPGTENDHPGSIWLQRTK